MYNLKAYLFRDDYEQTEETSMTNICSEITDWSVCTTLHAPFTSRQNKGELIKLINVNCTNGKQRKTEP